MFTLPSNFRGFGADSAVFRAIGAYVVVLAEHLGGEGNLHWLFSHLQRECPIETTEEGESYVGHAVREISVRHSRKGKVSGSILVAAKSVGAAVHAVTVQNQ